MGRCNQRLDGPQGATRLRCPWDCGTRQCARRWQEMRTSSWYETAGRVGLAARALVYALIASLMARTAFFQGNEDGVSPEEAFNWLEATGLGMLLLAALASGLFAYAGWRLIQGVMDTASEGSDAMGWLARLGMIASGIGYGLVGAGAVGVMAGRNDGEGDDATQSAVEWLLQLPFGSWLIIALGLAIAGIGCAQIWRAVAGKWKDGIDLSGGIQKLIPAIAFAIAGRGLLFVVIGIFVILAGWQASPEQAKGLSGTITWLRSQPYGLVLYLGAAFVLASYAVYSVVEAWRMRFSDEKASLQNNVAR